MEFAEFELKINLVGNCNGIANLLGVSAKSRCHLLGGLDVKLISVEPPTGFIRECLASLNAEQDFMRFGVRAMQIMAIVGRNQGYADGAAQFAEGLVQRPVQVIILQFKVEAAREGPRIPFGGFTRFVEPAATQSPCNLAA